MSDFVRMFANTDGGPASKVGWAFMRRLIRKRPVRLISMSPGGLAGCWAGYESLLVTPMVGDFINVVACEPSRWTWTERVRAPTKQLSPGEVTAGGVGGELEVSGRVELWTAGVRNVLIAVTLPGDTAKDARFQLETARKYDAVIVTNMADAEWLERQGIAAIEIGEPFPDVVVIEAILGAS